MNSGKLFKILSYAAVFCGFFSLWVSGTFGLFESGVFLIVMIAAWFLEGSRWQISEWVGTGLIVLAMPVFYLAFKYGVFAFTSSETMLPGILARLILSLTAIKLLQKKSDRDWVFLYLMSFFEVLLAAGLSISALYLFSFVAYVFIMVCTIILFEIKKTSSIAAKNELEKKHPESQSDTLPIRWLPAISVALIVFIIIFATPMFFLLPRVGGAGLGGNPGGVAAASGFADTVRLGKIGEIQQNDEVVMRIRLDGRGEDIPNIKWRGIALDTFDNQSWSRTNAALKEPRTKSEAGLIQIDYASGRDGLVMQTIYLEPLDTTVLFALPRAVGIQGNFQTLYTDAHDSITFQGRGERVSYKAYSDVTVPGEPALRDDRVRYSDDDRNYLQLPQKLDPRITSLAAQLSANRGNRYDIARAMESHLQNDYGYTLEQKASGDQPLADFLFNVREGHCEYFATAMAVMLRTQGIATRVINGFQRGEYNETADVFVVRQRNAHSWVEVYFPGENAWVPFDPTPFTGQNSIGGTVGIAARFNKYLEALETFWIQYFVAFDSQEQRSLFTSIRRGVADYSTKTTSWLENAQSRVAEWWRDVRGDKGFETSLAAIGWAIAYLAIGAIGLLVIVWLYRKVVKLKVWDVLWDRLFARRHASIVEFYDRMQEVLAGKGFTRELHQTPLEFAFAIGMPEAVMITQKYNRVRFGEKRLSRDETEEIENWLQEISTAETPSKKTRRQGDTEKGRPD